MSTFRYLLPVASSTTVIQKKSSMYTHTHYFKLDSIAYFIKFWEWHSSFSIYNIETWSVWFRIIVISVSVLFFHSCTRKGESCHCCHSTTISMYLCSSSSNSVVASLKTTSNSRRSRTLGLRVSSEYIDTKIDSPCFVAALFYFVTRSVQWSCCEHFYSAWISYLCRLYLFFVLFHCDFFVVVATNTWFLKWVLSNINNSVRYTQTICFCFKHNKHSFKQKKSKNKN